MSLRKRTVRTGFSRRFCSRKTAVFLPRAYSALDRYRPRTWVTEWTEQMGDTFTADLAVRVHPGGCTDDVRSCHLRRDDRGSVGAVGMVCHVWRQSETRPASSWSRFRLSGWRRSGRRLVSLLLELKTRFGPSDLTQMCHPCARSKVSPMCSVAQTPAPGPH